MTMPPALFTANPFAARAWSASHPEDRLILCGDPAVPAGDGVTPIASFWASSGEVPDGYALARQAFLRFVVQSGWIGAARWEGMSLVCPLRTSLFRDVHQDTERATLARLAMEAARPSLAWLDGSLPCPWREALRAEAARLGIPEAQPPTPRKGASYYLRALRTPGVVHSLGMALWRTWGVDRWIHRRSLRLAREKGLAQLRRLRQKRPHPGMLLFSTVSNRQRLGVCPPGPPRELLLHGFLEAGRELGHDPLVVSIMDDQQLEPAFLRHLDDHTIPWEGMAAHLEANPADAPDFLAHMAAVEADVDAWAAATAATPPEFLDGRPFSGAFIARQAAAMKRYARGELVKLRLAHAWLEWFQPSQIVLISELSGLAPVVMAAARLGIPCVALTHAMVYPSLMMYLYDAEEPVDAIPRPTLQCVWGRHEKALIAEHGAYMPPERVRVLGSPKTVIPLTPDKEAALRRQLGAPDGMPIALCTSNNRHHHFARELLKAWAPLGDRYFLVVKLHPRELNLGQYSYWARRLGVRRVAVLRHLDIMALLQCCAVHLSFSSTTIIEAGWLGKPTIIFDNGMKQDPLEAVAMGVATFASDHATLADAVAHVGDPAFLARFAARRPAFLERRFTADHTPASVLREAAAAPRADRVDFPGPVV